VAAHVLGTRELAEEDLIPLRAIYNDPLFAAVAEGIALLPEEDPAVVRQPTGKRRTVAAEVLAASDQCMHVEVRVDISAVVLDPPPPRRAYLELRPTQPSADANAINPTPWSISQEDQEVEPRCAP
jgi:hypothetical protein